MQSLSKASNRDVLLCVCFKQEEFKKCLLPSVLTGDSGRSAHKTLEWMLKVSPPEFPKCFPSYALNRREESSKSILCKEYVTWSAYHYSDFRIDD